MYTETVLCDRSKTRGHLHLVDCTWGLKCPHFLLYPCGTQVFPSIHLSPKPVLCAFFPANKKEGLECGIEYMMQLPTSLSMSFLSAKILALMATMIELEVGEKNLWLKKISSSWRQVKVLDDCVQHVFVLPRDEQEQNGLCNIVQHMQIEWVLCMHCVVMISLAYGIQMVESCFSWCGQTMVHPSHERSLPENAHVLGWMM